MKVPVDFHGGCVVIFGGSFDPITFTHIQVATEVINFGLADQVWIVPCGMRPDKHTNISPEQRCQMVSIALDAMVPKNFPLYVDRTEVDNGRFFPTRELMCHYRSTYPRLTFKILIGNDLLEGLHRWDDFPDLITENEFIVYDRVFTSECIVVPDAESFVTLNDEARTRMKVQRIRESYTAGIAPMLSNVSSTEIRKRLSARGINSIVGLTPLEVIFYIRENNLYNSKG